MFRNVSEDAARRPSQAWWYADTVCQRDVAGEPADADAAGPGAGDCGRVVLAKLLVHHPQPAEAVVALVAVHDELRAHQGPRVETSTMGRLGVSASTAATSATFAPRFLGSLPGAGCRRPPTSRNSRNSSTNSFPFSPRLGTRDPWRRHTLRRRGMPRAHECSGGRHCPCGLRLANKEEWRRENAGSDPTLLVPPPISIANGRHRKMQLDARDRVPT